MTNHNDPWALPTSKDENLEPSTTAFPPQQPANSKDAWAINEPGANAGQGFEQPDVPPFAEPEYQSQQDLATRGRKPWLIPLIVVLVLALVGLLGWVAYSFYMSFQNSDESEVVVTSVVVVPPAQSKGQQQQQKPQDAPVVAVPAPSWARSCGSAGGYGVYAGTSVTSCPFAANVGSAMSAHTKSAGSHSVSASSPVTGGVYSMYCRSRGAGNFECTGGDNAQVFLVSQ